VPDSSELASKPDIVTLGEFLASSFN